MAKKKNSISMNNIVNCAVYGIIGLLLIILKAGSLGILMTVVGVLLIALGISDALKGKELVKGAVEIVCGIAIIICGWAITDLVLLILGIVLAIKSGIELAKNYKKGFKANLESIVTLVIGILLIVAKWAFMNAMCVIAGIIFLINAVLALFGKKLSK